jgi:3-hydroxymyristoyl/3-hydroxydecanoyl-(acyl carrier protein) dehydratase
MISDQTAKRLLDQSQRINLAHLNFLKNRQASLELITAVVSRQIDRLPHVKIPLSLPSLRPLFDWPDLLEFATGSLVKVFGPKYAIFGSRRVPRIPNGDLLLFDQVTRLEGTPGVFDQTASITTSYSVPKDAWYLVHNAHPTLPFFILQELALQPCGFLSAWLGTSFLQPDQDLYFRNLDGQATLLWEPDCRGKQITANAQLISTTMGGGTIIQRYVFNLAIDSRIFFQGESVFGYFQAGVMSTQAGLDNSKSNLPTVNHQEGRPLALPAINVKQPYYHLPVGKLALLHQAELMINSHPGQPDELWVRKTNNPTDWFYTCHFFQDPVMPGSLGVEAVFQTLQAYALSKGIGRTFTSPRFRLLSGKPVQWKYRGQIVPKTRSLTFRVVINPPQQEKDGWIIRGDASLWADDVRIYEINQLGIQIVESV